MAFLAIVCSCVTDVAYALQGVTGIHDPSSIIKHNGVYHVWGTGDQIYHLMSTDLINWSLGPTVFPAGQWPSWINTYVPGFGGFFWAPECIYLNGKYYLYYSCSTGGRPSAIGLATSTDLVNWTDQGMVVYSDNVTRYGSIDAAVFQDAEANLWFVFGSHLNGIWMAQLDPATGKRLNSTLINVANVNDAEAGYVVRHGGYYYLFYNRGICCNGTNSTYHIQVGRSINPNGPYVDRSGRALSNATGTPFLSTSGRYFGPGHVGYFSENGVEYLTHHFYDSDVFGVPTLRVSNMRWDSAGWPYASADWIESGTYRITNQGNGLVWDAWGCAGNPLDAIAQNTYLGNRCQQWNFYSLGNGLYRIASAQSGLAAEVFNCSPAAGAKLDLYSYWGGNCQQFNLERASDGSYVFSSANGYRVVEVPNATNVVGTQLQLWDYNGSGAQRWLITAP
ncbi:MAG TPA: family 43 glycosylhydrolase [Blastocatellia bacterium]|nr:family 43 glycosylhydrolase [Blastocatellia bacterium]